MSPTERRTTALRGPGAGGFTPPTSVAASNPCLNCGTNIQLEYCPECGQREIDPDPTLREFAHELAEESLHWDGKLAKTFRTLVTKPGRLTVEYLAGRRVRYVSPLRVYLTCSVLYFFLSAVAPNQVVIDRSGRIDGTLSAIPKAMFVLVPLFAALIGVMYRDRRRKYPQHLAFALHVHAALFIMLSVMLGARLFHSPAAIGAYALLVMIPFAVYLVRATRTVYEGTTAQAVWRVSLACMMYLVALVGILTALFALIVLSY